jgi:hypothetical protein
LTSGPHTPFPELKFEWQTGEQFLESFEQTDEQALFFIPAGEEPFPDEAVPGAILSVRIRFLDRETEFHVHARVVERLTGEQAGLRLAFLEEEVARQELVLTCARGESLPYYRRQHERIPCQLPMRLTTQQGQDLETIAIGISEGGAQLAMDEPSLEEDTVVWLHINFPGQAETLRVRGRVANVVRQGPRPVVGIEFQFSSVEQRNAVHAQVSKLRGEAP